jgi:MoxR-like ATPase
LLQAMQERTVTIDRDTHHLDSNFTVFATQNPIEYEGTYQLPEAQKDRFVMKIPMGYPGREQEAELANRMLGQQSPEAVLDSGKIEAVLNGETLQQARLHLESVGLKEELIGYVVDLVRSTRNHECLLAGAGPRTTQALVLTSRARAAMDGRDFVTPDDIRELAIPVLEHRLVLRPEFEIEGITAAEVVRRVLGSVPVPR